MYLYEGNDRAETAIAHKIRLFSNEWDLTSIQKIRDQIAYLFQELPIQ